MASKTNGAPGAAATGEAEAKATAETYGRLDTSQVSNEVWMLRVPPKLAEVWQDAPEGTVLGDLVFTKGSSAKDTSKNKKPIKPSLEVHLSEEMAEKQSDLPLTYNLEAMTKRVPVLHPFSRKADGSVELHGTVSRTANLQMHRNDERYRQLCRNRLLQTNVNSNRYVRPVETAELPTRAVASALTNTAGFGSAVQHFGKRMMEDSENGAGENSRKRKYEGQTTRSVVFEMFSSQPYLTLKEMRNLSGRPEKELRAVLVEIGDFHRSGEHKSTWALRKEFQKQDGN